MEGLTELLERIKSASGPDRKTDLDIHCLFFPNDDIAKIAKGFWADQREWGVTHGSVWNRTEFGSASIPMPRYTASVDAALALVERVLPGCCPGVSQNVHHRYWFAWLSRVDAAGMPIEIGSANHLHSPPLAILAATLSALASQATP